MKNLKNVSGVKALSKNEQKTISGGKILFRDEAAPCPQGEGPYCSIGGITYCCSIPAG